MLDRWKLQALEVGDYVAIMHLVSSTMHGVGK